MVQLHDPTADEPYLLYEGHMIFSTAFKRLKQLDAEALDDLVGPLLDEVVGSLKNYGVPHSRLFLVLDEAQALLRTGLGYFTSRSDPSVKRALFSAFLNVLLPYSTRLTVVCAGTGFGMKEASEAAHSQVLKLGSSASETNLVFAKFDQYSSFEDWRVYEAAVLRDMLTEAQAARVFGVLTGRVRFTAAWFSFYDRAANVEKALEDLIEYATSSKNDKAILFSLRKHLDSDRAGSGGPHPGDQPSAAHHVLELARDLLVPSLLFGAQPIGSGVFILPPGHDGYIGKMVDYALSFISRGDSGQPLGFGEPLVRMALMRLLKEREQPLAGRLLVQLSQLAHCQSCLGFCLEYVLAPAWVLYLRQSRDSHPLPQDAEYPLPDWLNVSFATQIPSTYGLMPVKNDVHLDTDPVTSPFLCFPDVNAGPDLAIALESTNNAKYLMLAQWKYRRAIDTRDALNSVCRSHVYHTKKGRTDRTDKTIKLWNESGLSNNYLSVLFSFPGKASPKVIKEFRDEVAKEGGHILVLDRQTCPKLFEPWLQEAGINIEPTALWDMLESLKQTSKSESQGTLA